MCTVADCTSAPPEDSHERVKTVRSRMGELCASEDGSAMSENSSPLLPEMEHDVTFETSHLTVVRSPLRTKDGVARNDAVGVSVPDDEPLPPFSPDPDSASCVSSSPHSAHVKETPTHVDISPFESNAAARTVLVPAVAYVRDIDCAVPEGTCPSDGANWSIDPSASQSMP